MIDPSAVTVDGWGREIWVKCNIDGVVVVSAGPDGVLWNKDDIAFSGGKNVSGL